MANFSRDEKFMKTTQGQSTRTPHDGKPFYCIACGLGWAEVQACEDGGCEMEPRVVAKQRQEEHKSNEKSEAWEAARELVNEGVADLISELAIGGEITETCVRQFIVMKMIEDLSALDRKPAKNFVKAALKLADPKCTDAALHLSAGALRSAAKKLEKASMGYEGLDQPAS